MDNNGTNWDNVELLIQYLYDNLETMHDVRGAINKGNWELFPDGGMLDALEVLRETITEALPTIKNLINEIEKGTGE